MPTGTKRTVQTATLTRTATYNEVTGKLTNLGDWTTGAWDSYPVSAPDGYEVANIEQTVDGNSRRISVIDPETVTADTPNQVITISYKAKANPTNPDNPNNPSNPTHPTNPTNPSNPETPGKPGQPNVPGQGGTASDGRGTASDGLDHSSQLTETGKKKANRLPQTGNGDHAQASTLGVLGLAMAGLLGMAGARKKKDDQ